MKLFSDSYLYQKADYGRDIYKYLMQAERIDKNSDAFADIVYEIKMRQISPIILKVLLSNRVVLCIDKKGLSRAFKVIQAKDLKSVDKKSRLVYIDCSGLIEYKNGKYHCNNIKILISYLVQAMTYVVFYNVPEKIWNDTILVQSSTEAFVDSMLYVLGYLKFPVTYEDNKERASYVLALYYLFNILERRSNVDINIATAKKISGLPDRTCQYLYTTFADVILEKDYTIRDFIVKFVKVFLNYDPTEVDGKKDTLNVDVLVQRWMYAFGPGTFLGLELFVPFAAMLTDAYIGAYINQQNTIEKVVGKNMVKFTNELLKVGSES